MFDHAAPTQIDRLAGAHQRWEDDQAEAQDRAEKRVTSITNNAALREDIISEHILRCDERNMVAEVLGQWAFEGASKMTKAERDRGILDLAHLILIPMAYEAIAAAAAKEAQV